MTPLARVQELIGRGAPVSGEAAAAARRHHDTLAKPPGSLGALETLGARLAAVAGVCPPPVPAAPAVVVAAGDHGVHRHGVTPWPQSVTGAMVRAVCDGQASVNAIARTVGARVAVLDVGVAGPRLRHPLLRDARVADGTADLRTGPAMRTGQAAQAVLAGAGLAADLVASGVDLLATGDLGIANTTPSACLVAAFTGRTPEEVTGPGSGADAQMVAHKRAVVGEALALHQPDPADPLGVLAALGGLEHAALAGVILAGAASRVPVVLDGLIAGAAALPAVALCPAAAGYLVAGHRSTEPGATAALEHLGLEPLLDLGMRLGEGTGALCAVPLVTAAARLLRDVAALHELA